MHDFKFYASATIGMKGQIVIPIDARNELNLSEGEKVMIFKAPHHNGLLVLKADEIAEIVTGMSTRVEEITKSVNN